MQARGLKLDGWVCAAGAGRVAPHAGAWIETCPWAPTPRWLPSRLMQARGLKLDDARQQAWGRMSRLMQARGLKLAV